MSKAKSTRPPFTRASVRQQVHAQRQRLLGADAVIMCCRYALDSQTAGLDELRVMDALGVASEIVNDVAAALEALK